MSGAPRARFLPGDLSDPREPGLSTAELAEAMAVGRELERLAATRDLRPSDGFVSAVMAAIASEPLPAPIAALGNAMRAKRTRGVLRALADIWRVAWTGGRPLNTRIQGVAFALVIAMTVAAAGGAALVGAASWLSHSPPPFRPHVTEPAVGPEPSRAAIPSGSRDARPTATPGRSPSQSSSTATASPSPERSGSPGSINTPHPTATPQETEEPDGTSAPQSTETPDESGSDDAAEGG